MTDSENVDLAGKTFWDDTWKHTKKIKSVNLCYKHHQALHQLFAKWLPTRQDGALLEIGAANSYWLPYIAQTFQYQVSGLDYSELGCEQALYNLDYFHVPGEIYNRDLFDENEDLQNRFDVVFSLGVVEHFTDPSLPLSKIRDFCKDDGIIITVIPNLVGIYGVLQRLVKKDIYDLHVPMTPKQLAHYHEQVGLKVKTLEYSGFFSLTIINFSFLPNLMLRAAYRTMMLLNQIIWKISDLINFQPETKTFSPYVIVVATKESE